MGGKRTFRQSHWQRKGEGLPVYLNWYSATLLPPHLSLITGLARIHNDVNPASAS